MRLVQYYNHNAGGRTFIVGDIHGCYDQLMALLAAVNFDFDKDLLYAVGDLVDRGPDSIKVLQLIGQKWFRAVRGNHEELLIDAATQPAFDWQHWIDHGGRWAHDLSRIDLLHWANVVAALPVAIVVGKGVDRYNIFHAEFHGDDAKLDAVADLERPPLTLQWSKSLIKGEVDKKWHAGLSTSFVGHSIVKDPCIIGSHVFIDTGGFHAHRGSTTFGLTMVEPFTQNFWRYRNGAVIHE